MSSVAVIDYGMGNLHSISKALQHADAAATVKIVSDADSIMRADRIIFPGVGAIGDCMSALESSGLAEVIKEVASQKPLLGICLGMQALLGFSEENGTTQCLNLIEGSVVRFPQALRDNDGRQLKIPHMGWNTVAQQPHPLWNNIPDQSRFYFVHSYYAKPSNPHHTVATSCYPQAFTCAIAYKNIFAVQFHPEKSQQVGIQLLTNFLHWDGVYNNKD